jgi:hypothetical protein
LPLHHRAVHQSNSHPPTTPIKPRTLSVFRIDVRLHFPYCCCPFRCLLSIRLAYASSSFLASPCFVSFAYILSQGICVISRKNSRQQPHEKTMLYLLLVSSISACAMEVFSCLFWFLNHIHASSGHPHCSA